MIHFQYFWKLSIGNSQSGRCWSENSRWFQVRRYFFGGSPNVVIALQMYKLFTKESDSKKLNLQGKSESVYSMFPAEFNFD